MSEFPPRRRLVSLILGASVLVTFASTGCVVHHHHSYGRDVHAVSVPPRSAAHGYVHHYRDYVLVFDHSWNGYWVRGHPHHYFYVDHYYRWHGGHWQKARRFGGPWVSVDLQALPPGLHRRTEKERREAARERREERREELQERREERREELRERREVAGERREELQERREERREELQERREVAGERRDERREAARERREERREELQERREAAKERWDERRGAARERREERREELQERREERREIAASAKSPRAGKPPGERSRGSAKRPKPTVPEDEDEEVPANHDVE